MSVKFLSVNLFVADLKQAQDFYAEAFQADRIDEDHFKIGNYDFALAAVLDWTPIMRGGVGLCIQLGLEDLELALERFLAAGGKISAPGTEQSPIFRTPNGQRVANVTDLDGHVWSLTEV